MQSVIMTIIGDIEIEVDLDARLEADWVASMRWRYVALGYYYHPEPRLNRMIHLAAIGPSLQWLS